MGRIAEYERISELAEDFKIRFDERFKPIADRMQDSLTAFQKNELHYFFAGDLFGSRLEAAYYKIVIDNDHLQSPADFIGFMENSAPVVLLANMTRAVYHDRLGSFLQGHSWEEVAGDPKRLLELAEAASASQPALRDRLLQCLSEPEETAVRFRYLLQSFYERAYRPSADEIAALAREGIGKYEQLLQENEETFFKSIIMDSPDMYRAPTFIHISFIAQVQLSIYNAGSSVRTWILLGILNDRHMNRTEHKDTVEKTLKALADKRRLEIITLLAQRSWYGQELAKHLELTPAAVNYHMNFLWMLQIVQNERVDHRLYHSLDKKRLKELLDLVQTVLLGD